MLENSQANRVFDESVCGDLKDSSKRFAIIVSTYNSDISSGLLNGCLKALDECNISESQYKVVETDGAFELPLLAKICAESFDAVICLGAVIKGDTAHFDYVAGECARGLQEVSLGCQKPIIFGVLTTLTLEQAIVRSSDDSHNKGYESALTALKMCSLCDKLKKIE
ncbi:6,7-dimethyl-8-ribityllumazine synthase [Candidatus Marinamargulisbacteria bacterium SCGC AG-343-D04]|nr:6,7-dimethyl-8-ribityllumazine synthase [Candidatus Marinamargulisbacteria bacterium SCGC AG-343-D04]